MSPGAPIAHVAKARGFVAGATLLLERGLADQATAEAYYAVFHLAQALLATVGIHAETHAGVRTVLGRMFIQGGKLRPDFGRDYGRLLADRQTASDVVEAAMTRATAASAAGEAARLSLLMLPVLLDRAPETANEAAALNADNAALAAVANGP